MASRLTSRWLARLLRPVDAAWLAAFRILLGLTLGVSMLRFLTNDWVERLFVQPGFLFKYWGLPAAPPLDSAPMHALFVVLALLALCVAAGCAFRITAPAFALGFTYVQLLDVSTYLNHYYLAALFAWLLAVSPAHRVWSVDAWLSARRASAPSAAPRTIAAGWQWLLRVQVGVVYSYAGLAKAQPDWLLHAQPLRIWLGASTDLPLVGPLFTLEWTPLVLSWCGFLFDSTIVAWLLQRKTRAYAYAVVVVFHTFTRLLFPIGMFPVIMTAAATVFFDADWPRRLVARLRRRRDAAASAPRPTPPAPVSSTAAPARSAGTAVGLGLGLLYCAFQVLFPLRFLLYGGNVLWHEQGMRFSWRVMVRAKGGSTTFIVRQRETGRVWHVQPRAYLTDMQESEMSSQPDLILQLAHHIGRDFTERGLGPVEVKVDSLVSLNGRRSARLVDPTVDLLSVRDGLARADWILPAPTEPPPHTRPVR